MSKLLAKRMIYSFKAKQADQIKHKIANAHVVSFDVFDTLVKRDVPTPSDVFFVMERQLQREGFSDGKDFAKKRIEAEKSARTKYPEREVTLKEIYECLQLDIDNKTRLMQLECETEIAVSTPHIPMKEIYDECVRKGKTILFISDMYLPSSIILNILQKNGYTTGKLYVSSESGLTKHSGKLFSYIQEQETLVPKKWVHIGDTISSDYLIPKKLGIRSFLIDHDPKYNTIVNRKLYRANKEYQALTQFINNRISRYSGFYEQLGYAVLGPLLYGFVKWLDAQDLEDETIVFLARDGALLKEAFEIISNKPSVYLHISRRSALCAAISQTDDYRSVSQYKIRTMKNVHTQKDMSLHYGLSEQETKILFASAGLDENKIISSPATEIVVLKTIWPAARKKSEEQHMLLQRYLEQLGVPDKCTVVDLGWSGTIQLLLCRSNFYANGNKMRWNGCYLGTREGGDATAYHEILKNSFLFCVSPTSEEKIWNTILSTIGFFELLFLTTEGSTKGYAETDNEKVYPVKMESDNSAEVMKVIKSIQKAGLRFVSDVHVSSCVNEIQIDSHIAAVNYLDFVERISLSEIRRIRDFKESDGVGDTVASLVNERGFLYYMLHPQKFKRDFTRATCKAFFLKGVFKLPLPYVSILTVLRKHFRTQ